MTAPSVPAGDVAKLVEELREEREINGHWRKLALQSDMHRIAALCVIRGVVAGKVTSEECAKFLASPPPSGARP